MIQIIDGALYKKMIINAAALVEQNKQQINDLNVFPVPDGDTGTNMSLTLNNAKNELLKKGDMGVGALSAVTSNALLRGARGNSGVITSLLFRGMSKAFKDSDTADAKLFAEALQSGVDAAYKAVMKPTEGTILTVSRLAAKEAQKAAKSAKDIEDFLDAVIARANDALASTTDMNPVLKKAGVVDAGGVGFVKILTGMLMAVRGENIEVEDSGEDEASSENVFAKFDTEDIRFKYCTEFIVSRENIKDPDVLRDYLAGVGDCVVLVDDDEIIKVHVHTNEPGNVITQALTYGSLVTVKIENMREQHTSMIEEEPEEQEDKPAEIEKEFGIVGVCAGDGLTALFGELGADNVITGGQTMNPSTEDILKAIEQTPASTVFVLPNNKNIIMAAQQCVSISTRDVKVIPTKTVPQGIAALIDFDPSLSAEECEKALNEAAERVHTALITYAARDSEFDGHSISAGEYLALLEGTLLINSSDLDEVLKAVSDALSGFSPEIVTMYYGEDVDEESAEAACAKMSADMPECEVSAISGGQPVYYYMISAE